jgi:hypothetical protein
MVKRLCLGFLKRLTTLFSSRNEVFNPNGRARFHSVEQIDHIRVAHSHATVAGWGAQ